MPDYKSEIIKVQTDNGDIVLSNQIVRETLAIGNNITDSEIYNFMMLCKYRNLNPCLKEAYIVKYGDNVQILVGKDAMIKRLHNNPACEGWEAGVIAWDKEGMKIVEREGSFFLKDEELVGAYYTEDEVGIPSDAIDVTPETNPPKQKTESPKQKVESEKTTIEQNQIAQLCITASEGAKAGKYDTNELLDFVMEALVKRGVLTRTSKRALPKDKFKIVLDYAKKVIDQKQKQEANLEALEQKQKEAAQLEKEPSKKPEEPTIPEGLPIENTKHAQPAGKKEDSKTEGDSKVGN